MTARPEDPAPPYNLRLVLRRYRDPTANGWGVEEPTGPLQEPNADVTVCAEGPKELATDPLPILGGVDGVQQLRVLAWREHRPVWLGYVGAGVWDGRRLYHVHERVVMLCSTVDLDWVREQGPPPVPVRPIPEARPPYLEQEAQVRLDRMRRRAEAATVLAVAQQTDLPVLVDGTIWGYRSERVVGVSKTVRTRWLPDPLNDQLWNLPFGWRSTRFRIEKAGGVWSCYVRITAPRRSWRHGLVRLEARDRDLLEPLGAWCLRGRQRAGTMLDPRGDRHVRLVRETEEALKARIPPELRHM